MAQPFPATFIRPPLSRLPPNPSYIWAYIKTKFRDFASRAATEFSSKPTLTTARRFKQQNSKVVAEAKSVHAAMYDALAKGDRGVILKVCSVSLSDRFVRMIDARPAGRRYGWELVRYNKTWLFPRIVDNKVAPAPVDPSERARKGPRLIRQVVVAIHSRQRRVEYDWTREGGGRAIPGSEKEADVVENVVLNQVLDAKTFKPVTEWKILNLMSETTLEKWREEEELLKEMERMEMEGVTKKVGVKRGDLV
jgi:mitochondrial protein MBA1